MISNHIFGSDEQDLLRKVVIFYPVIGGKNKIILPLKYENIDRLKYNQIRSNLVIILKKDENVIRRIQDYPMAVRKTLQMKTLLSAKNKTLVPGKTYPNFI